MVIVQLPTIAVLEVTGKDASRIANNLCTADVSKLEPGRGREAFVTEVRGKALGHVCIFRTEQGVRLIGAGADRSAATCNQASVMAAHFDRYTIREQSVPEDVSEQSTAFVVDNVHETALGIEIARGAQTIDLRSAPFIIDGFSVGTAYQVPWWTGGNLLVLVDMSAAEITKKRLLDAGATEADEQEFHRRRIQNRFPWYGVDIDATNLPQEADRDDLAISFTKGCYLGQETIARLDSLGQVQKKLVRWNVTGMMPPAPGTELRAGERVVGRLTSVAAGTAANEFIALGFARRSHFDAGSQATAIGIDGSALTAIVSER